MSYFLHHAKREAEELINELVEESEYKDKIYFNSRISKEFKERLIEKLALRLHLYRTYNE